MKKVFKLMKLFVLVLLLGCSFSFVACNDDENVPQLPEEDGPQHEKRCQKAKGVQGQRRQLRQAQVQQKVGYSPECGGQYQQQIRFTLPAHISSLPYSISLTGHYITPFPQ